METSNYEAQQDFDNLAAINLCSESDQYQFALIPERYNETPEIHPLHCHPTYHLSMHASIFYKYNYYNYEVINP